MASGITRLNGKVAIITGAAEGIGRAIAMRLAEEGAKVAIADINDAVAAKTAEEIRPSGAQAVAVKFDVTSLDEATAAVAKVERELGPIDILVNNAGWDKVEPFVDNTAETWDRVIAVNFRGRNELLQGRDPRHAGARPRQNSDDLFGRRTRRVNGRGGLCGMQGRSDRLFQNAGARAGPQQYQCQCRLPGSN